MKSTLLIICLLVLSLNVSAQNLSSSKGSSTMGIGMGLPYGGFGLKFNHHILNYFSAFGGVGYNLVGIGVNGGLNFTVPTEKNAEFYFTGMYGYNAVMKFENYSALNTTYYGASLGSGIKINSQRHEGRYWDIGILAPLRNSRYKSDIKYFESSIESKPWPVQLYFGYHFSLNSKN
ncbi:hypothetical protein ACFSKL_23030 [Belliella marina]|uniref:Outer membrane protein beta-barrel domain-containing protein n=1 Tax=Belliella marina TaxID=1644146 RepID=A0ABW4VTQ6_9BACT